MTDEQGDERRGAQNESPAEREAKKTTKQQDLDKPPAGRDEPPAEPIEQGKRSRSGPWLGGG